MKGSDWIKNRFNGEMSTLGIMVADILGTTWRGIYYLGSDIAIKRHNGDNDWSDEDRVAIRIWGNDLANHDYDHLSILWVLCGDNKINLRINPRNHEYIELLFLRPGHPGIFQPTPTTEEMIENARKHSTSSEKVKRNR